MTTIEANGRMDIEQALSAHDDRLRRAESDLAVVRALQEQSSARQDRHNDQIDRRIEKLITSMETIRRVMWSGMGGITVIAFLVPFLVRWLMG